MDTNTISVDQANNLLKDDSYIKDSDLIDLTINNKKKRLNNLHESSVTKDRVKAEDNLEAKDLETTLIIDLASRKATSYSVDTNLDKRIDSFEFRVKPYTVFHIGKALRLAIIEGLGLFLAYAGLNAISPLYGIWFGYKTIDIVKRFIDCYEKLDKNDEKIVFETVYMLQAQSAEENIESLKEINFTKAFGELSPLEILITDKLKYKLEPEKVIDILHDLKTREILGKKKGKWSVKIW